MILLDTNVISELIRRAPAPQVLAWMSRQFAPSLYLSAVTEAELRTGLLLMPIGQRRDKLAQATETMLKTLFSGHVLPFDQAAARFFAEIIVIRRSLGRPVAVQDAQIAAIAKANGMPIATRNVRDFEDIGVTIIDPWA